MWHSKRYHLFAVMGQTMGDGKKKKTARAVRASLPTTRYGACYCIKETIALDFEPESR